MYRILQASLIFAVTVACSGGPIGGDDTDGGGGDDEVDAMPIDAAPVPCVLPELGDGVSTLAGCAEPGTDDGPRGVGRFSNPVNVLGTGAGGDVYVADFDSGRVRVVSPDGTTRTLVAQTNFLKPFGLALAGGALYVSTDDNDRGTHSPDTGTVWRVNLSTGAATVIVRDVGRPRGLMPLPDGRLVLSDYVHHTVSLLDPATGRVSLLAGARDLAGYADGTGGAARFSSPYGVALLPDGRIAVADYGNHRIRAVGLDGKVTTLAGTGLLGRVDGPATTASLGYPQGLASDSTGILYITDTASYTIRTLEQDKVATVAGAGAGGWSDGALRDAAFWGLEGMAVSPDGNTLWVADGSRGEPKPYNRVRRVLLP